GDWDRNPAIGRPVHRIGQPDKAVLFAVAVKINFGGETAPRAGHQWLLCTRRTSLFHSMKALCLRLNCTPFRPDTGNSGRAQARTWATAHERLRVECLQPLNVRFPAMRTPAFSKSTTAAHHPFEPFGMRNRGQQLVACAGPLAAKE